MHWYLVSLSSPLLRYIPSICCLCIILCKHTCPGFVSFGLTSVYLHTLLKCYPPYKYEGFGCSLCQVHWTRQVHQTCQVHLTRQFSGLIRFTGLVLLLLLLLFVWLLLLSLTFLLPSFALVTLVIVFLKLYRHLVL